MNILLTGSTGFIGQNVLKKLISEDHSVTCILRKNSNINEDHLKCYKIFYENNCKLKTEEFEKIDCIIHLATHFTNNHKII